MPLNFATKAFSYILAQFCASFCWKLSIILVSRMRISQNLDFLKFVCFFFFADSFLIFFSLLFLSFFSPFLFSLSSTLYHLSIHCKSFCLSPSKNLEMEHWSTRWLGLFYHQLCSQNWTRFSGIALQNLVDIQNGHTYGWICPCCASCLSKQSGDVKNDDIISGSMVPDFNVGKIQLLTEKS